MRSLFAGSLEWRVPSRLAYDSHRSPLLILVSIDSPAMLRKVSVPCRGKSG